MKKYHTILLIILALLTFNLIPNRFFAQQRRPVSGRHVKPPIYYHLFKHFSERQAGFYVSFVLYVQYDILQFNKSDDGFTAQFEVTLNFRDKEKKKSCLEKIWVETIKENDFQRTNSKRIYHSSVVDIDISGLTPDEYFIYLEVKDKMSGKEFKRQIEMNTSEEVVGFKNTEIYLLKKDRFIPAEIQLAEEERVVEFDQQFRAYMEVGTAERDSIIILSRLFAIDDGKEMLLQDSTYRYFSDSDIFIFEEPFPTDHINEGEFVWRYGITYSRSTYRLEKPFKIVWFEKPFSLSDIRKAIKPMIYILNDAEWDEVQDKNKQALKLWFAAYWKARDENKNTPLNEVMFQFYQRVDQANLRFRSGNKEGWESDRGKAYILYGEPDEIERQKHVVDTAPYEIWIYRRMNQKLTFVDKNRDNNYQLVAIQDLEVTADE